MEKTMWHLFCREENAISLANPNAPKNGANRKKNGGKQLRLEILSISASDASGSLQASRLSRLTEKEPTNPFLL